MCTSMHLSRARSAFRLLAALDRSAGPFSRQLRVGGKIVRDCRNELENGEGDYRDPLQQGNEVISAADVLVVHRWLNLGIARRWQPVQLVPHNLVHALAVVGTSPQSARGTNSTPDARPGEPLNADGCAKYCAGTAQITVDRATSRRRTPSMNRCGCLRFRSLRRRSQRRLTSDGYAVPLQRFPLPTPRMAHPCEAWSASSGHLQEEPYAGEPHVESLRAKPNGQATRLSAQSVVERMVAV